MLVFNFGQYNEEREILQITILDSIYNSRLGRLLIFHGGTGLRLCYRSDRFSDDLDFRGSLSGKEFNELKDIIYSELVKKIAHRVEIGSNEKDNLYQIVTKVHPKDKSKKLLKVNITISPIKPLTSEFINAYSKYYPTLSVPVYVESLEEILADKLVAFGLRNFTENAPFKARDLWDIYWIIQHNIKLDGNMVFIKLQSYNVTFDQFTILVKNKLDFLCTKKGTHSFKDEIDRFLDNSHKSLILEENSVKSILKAISSFYNNALEDLTKHKTKDKKHGLET